MLHIYTETMQPATCWIDTHSGAPITFRWPADKMLWAQCCGKRRAAKNCVVQSYYDGLSIWCAEGCGCKHPRTIAAKRRAEHMNRSRAQQARRERERQVLCCAP